MTCKKPQPVKGIRKRLCAFGGGKDVGKRLYAFGGGNVLLTVLTVAACFGIAALSSEMAYLSNDDTGIQNLLAGNVTGEPYVTHQFINVLLGVLISSLYQILPGVQWWYVYSLLLTGMGMVLLHFAIFWISRGRGLPLWLPWLAVFVVDMAFLVYPVANISFTIVPAILGTGLVAVLFFLKEVQSRKWRRVLHGVIPAGDFLVLIHRVDTGLALLCYLLLGYLYYFWTDRKEGLYCFRTDRKEGLYCLWTDSKEGRKKTAFRFAVVCGGFVLLTAAILGLNAFSVEKLNGSAFVEFNRARGAYMDKPRDSYDSNEELYEAVGWDENVYRLVNGWCFMDQAVTAESFRYITENSVIKEDLVARSRSLLMSVLEDARCRALLLLWGCSACFSLWLLLVGYDLKYALFLGLNNGGSVLLLFYQLLTGRILYRSVLVVVLPAFVINVLLALRHGRLSGKKKYFFGFAALLALLLCSRAVSSYVFDTDRNSYKRELLAQSAAVEEYAGSHPGDVFISTTGFYNSISPRKAEAPNRPTNVIPWGGSAYHSDSYHRRLKRNGLETLSGEALKLENVYFACNVNLLTLSPSVASDTVVRYFYDYLQEKFGAKGFVLADRVGEKSYIYRFVFPENEARFEEYYRILEGNVIRVRAGE